MAGTNDSELAFPIPEPPPSTRPASAPFAFETSVAPHIVRDTSTTLHDIAHEIAARVPYPIIFIAGASLGILIATSYVTWARRSAHAAAPTVETTQLAAPLAPKWAPLPVVTIHPAPPDPVETLPAAGPEGLAAAKVDVAPPAPHAQRARRFVKAAPRAPRPVPVATAHDLLADAL